MSHRWTDHELRVLKELARPGVSLDAILTAYNERRGTRQRTRIALVDMLNLQRFRYGTLYQYWEPDEILLLERLAGHATVKEIIAAIEQECGKVRSAPSIRAQLWDMGLSAWPVDYISSGDIARALGMSVNGVLRYIELGAIAARQEGTERARRWRVRPAAVDAFLDEDFLMFDPARMPRGVFRSRVELRWREGRYLTTEQGATMSGSSRSVVIEACRLGRLPAGRARTLGTNGTARWWIRANDLAAWMANRPSGKLAA